jgi:hypothetical protein
MMTTKQMEDNKLSDAIMEIVQPLVARQEHLDTVELLLQAAHKLHTCLDCQERPCECEIPFL